LYVYVFVSERSLSYRSSDLIDFITFSMFLTCHFKKT